MILELDCGNTLIKWRVVARDGKKLADGAVEQLDALLGAVAAMPGDVVEFIRLVSVRSEQETAQLAGALKALFGVEVASAGSSAELLGVRNGYDDYARLGLDRWLALVAAKKRSPRGVLVVDLGTAITADFVSATGEHLGGFICPGLPLMRNQLRTHTRRIRYDDTEAAEARSLVVPGRNTAQAVERGCLHMVRGFVEDQVELARQLLGEFDVFLTGGDAGMVASCVPQAEVRPDLVFEGLALACPVKGV